MNKIDKVAVCSRSFSKSTLLKETLLSKYKFVKFNDEGKSLQGEALIEFLKNENKVICGLEEFSEEILDQLPYLNVISKYGVGIDNLDLSEMAEKEIKLGWSPGVNKRSVSELVLALSLSLLRYIPESNEDLKQGNWNQFKGNLLTNKTFGIIGFGNIGRDLCELLHPFNCKILFYDIFAMKNNNELIQQVSLKELLNESDVVSIHLPLNKDTKEIINLDTLKEMKSSAVLINLSRGGIINEPDLKKALQDGLIRSAAMDVFLKEPPDDSELLNLPNFLATPHIAGTALESVESMGLAAIEGLDNNKIPNKI